MALGQWLLLNTKRFMSFVTPLFRNYTNKHPGVMNVAEILCSTYTQEALYVFAQRSQ